VVKAIALQTMIFFLFAFAGFSSRAQRAKASLKVSVKDCRTGQTDDYATIRLYRLSADTPSYIISKRRPDKDFRVIKRFVPSTYRLQYENLYRQKINKTVALDSQGLNQLAICVDELQDYPVQTLERLKEGDSIVIKYVSMGCFYRVVCSLSVVKISDAYEATLYRGPRWRPSFLDEGSSERITTRLTPQNIADFTRFENEMNHIPQGGCTTVDYYVISRDRIVSDAGCAWEGFYHLCRSFFGNDFDFFPK
jgi:hypothetical protein